MDWSQTYGLTTCTLDIVEYPFQIRFIDILVMKPVTKSQPYISNSHANKTLKY